MKFRLEHRFEASLEAVERAMLSRDLGPYLLEHHAQLLECELLDFSEQGSTVRRRVRYRPRPLIEKIGPKRVPPEWMAWIEESSFDRNRHRMQFVNRPTVAGIAELLANHGTMELRAEGASRTTRVVDGELKIKVMLLGAIAERIIHKQAVAILDEEARVLGQFLRR